MLKGTILAFFGSVFMVILFNIDSKKLFWAGACGAIGWVVYSFAMRLSYSVGVASFLGALMVGLCSEFLARKIKTPASMFSIPGIFPLVPGLTGFSTIRYIVENEPSMAFSKGMETVAVGGAIGLGIMLASTMAHFATIVHERRTAR